MLQRKEMTDEEKFEMYMKLTKRELVEILIGYKAELNAIRLVDKLKYNIQKFDSLTDPNK
jgi:hypothetical protein